MSTCIKDLMYYDLIKKCSKCGINSLKYTFYIDRTKKDGFRPDCKFCVSENSKNYYNKNRDSKLELCKKYRFHNREKINEYIENRLKTDLKFKLAKYMRNRLYQAYKAQNVRKMKNTFDLFECSHPFLKKWIIHQ